MTIYSGQFCNYDSDCVYLYGNSVLLLDEDLPVLCTLKHSGLQHHWYLLDSVLPTQSPKRLPRAAIRTMPRSKRK